MHLFDPGGWGGGLQFIVRTENLFSVMASDVKTILLGIKGGGVGF